jgi:Helicase HerA, central domain
MTLPSYEKLGVFYLGREYDPQSQALGDELLYDSRDLTTHAVCIGMTGSGKTGLCLSLLEEAALDGVPAIVIDPKGDIGNLLLTFPDLKAADFQPWVDAGEASRKGQSVEDFASATADTWRKGLAEWNQDGARIQRLRDAAEVAIYTPGSNSGRPLSILRSFTAPDAATSSDATALKERIGSAVAGLLGLLDIDADPIRSREHILLSAILDAVWRKGQSPDLAAIIQAVQKPPFEKVGVFDVESFYPAKDRMELALRVNGLLASPGFEAWLEGDALDIQKLLYTDAGKPRISIISIAHLNDAERMFVVTLIANELVAWMRRQSGTTSLRAVFYMDEVFGYFPPSAMPPSKLPMLTLMKQARAFGLGVVLATQNPVDLDYKGLGNAGTWFIGRLQTERDKNRVIEGLLGTQAAGGMDRAGLEALMSNLTQRTFLMRNVHEDAPVLFRTRWALSYLRGPLTLAEIKRLTDGAGRLAPGGPAASASTARTPTAGMAPASNDAAASSRPVLQAGVTERFVRAGADATPVAYQPRIGAKVRAHFVDAKAGMNAWEESYYLAPLDKDAPDWSQAEVLAEPGPEWEDEPRGGARFADVPAAALSPRNHRAWSGALEDHVYRTASLNVMSCPALKMKAAPGGTEGEFRAHIAQALREKRDTAVDALRARFASKLAALEDRERRAEQKLERERMQASSETVSSALSVGGSLLGALFGGRRSSAMRKASTAARSVGRASKERGDVAHAEADVAALEGQVTAMNAELEAEIGRIEAEFDPNTIRVEMVLVRPKKADISVEDVALVWCP